MKRLLLFCCIVYGVHFSNAQTWAGDIAKIIYANCTPCHHNGGLAPSSFMTYQEAEAAKFGINYAVTNRIMPPWPADPNYRHYAHEMVLTSAEITAINNWVTNGAPQGNMATAPAPPVYNNSTQLGTVDLSLQMQNYTVTSSGDVYRNFVINTGLTQTKYATAIEIIPGNPEIVHHVLVFMDTTNNPIDPNSAGGTGSNASKLIYGYVPGAQPYFSPPGTGFRLPANTRIIFQMHYAPGSQGLSDQTTINLKLTTTPQREISVYPLLNHITSMTNGPINIPANQTRTYYEQFPISGNWTMLYAWPHMHMVGKNIISFATTSTPNDTIRFVNVPDWDFHWQQNYVFANTQKINNGTTLKARAFYDNTTNNLNNPNSPPQTVTAGEGTGDEMMMVFFAYMPYQAGDENLIVDKRILPRSGTTFCTGQSVLLETIEGNGYTYQWYRNNNVIPGATSSSYTATLSGNYTVSITLGTNNAVSDPVTVTVNSAPTATITPAGSTSICNGNSVTLNANTGSGLSYQWYKNDTLIINATSATYNANAGGNYTVQVSNGCSATSQAVSVITGPGPDATVTPNGATTFCQGGNVTLSAPAGLSYNWSNGANTQSISVNQSGTYTVTVSNGNNCTAVSSNTVVTVNSVPPTNVTANGPTTFCSGSSVTLSAPAGLNYQWNTGAQTASINVTQSGSYNVTVTNAVNCSASSANTVINVNQSPSAGITTSGATSFCPGGSVNLTASGGTQYQWNNGSSTNSISTQQSGTYTVTVSNAAGCTATASRVITVFSAPSANVTSDKPTTICPGDTVILSAEAGLSYVWSNGATDQSIAAFANGSFTVTVTDANGCTAVSSPQVVTLSNNAVAGITTSGATTFCQGQNVTLTATQGNAYLWSNGATSPSIVVNQNGNYTVTVTVLANCTAVSVPQTVTVNSNPATPVVSLSGVTTFCFGGSVYLIAPAGYSYTWSNNETSDSVLVSTSGSFTLTVTDTNGCSASSAPVNVTVNSLPAVSLSGNPDTVCLNSAGISLSGGTPAGGSYAGNSVNNGIFTPSAAGTQNISYTYTDGNGCSASSTENMEVVVCTGIFNTQDDIAFTAFPNPTQSQLFLHFDRSRLAQLIIYETTGKILNTLRLNGLQHNIDLAEYAAGLYLFEIQSEGLIKRFSVVKE